MLKDVLVKRKIKKKKIWRNLMGSCASPLCYQNDCLLKYDMATEWCSKQEACLCEHKKSIKYLDRSTVYCNFIFFPERCQWLQPKKSCLEHFLNRLYSLFLRTHIGFKETIQVLWFYFFHVSRNTPAKSVHFHSSYDGNNGAKAQSTGWTKIMGSLEIQPGAF